MHSKSDNKEIRSGSDTEEIIEELFHSLLQNYQVGSEQLMKGSNFCLITLMDSLNSLVNISFLWERYCQNYQQDFSKIAKSFLLGAVFSANL